jgi:TonB family protein
MRWSFALLATVLGGAAPDGGPVVEVRWLDATDAGNLPGGAGSVELEVIRSVVRSHHAELKACYEPSLGQARRPVGTAKLRWAIGEDGEVRAVEVLSSTHGVPALDTCIAEAVRSWRFPRPRGGGAVVVTYPFVFRDAAFPRDGDESKAASPGTPDAGP